MNFLKEFIQKNKKMALDFLYNTKLVQDLFKHGCTNKKTFIINFPELEKKLIRHFMRGYFDGDGSAQKIKNRFNIVCANYDFLNEYNNQLNISLNLNLNIKKSKNGNIYILEFNNKNKKEKIAKFFYDDATIFLNRKQKNF